MKTNKRYLPLKLLSAVGLSASLLTGCLTAEEQAALEAALLVNQTTQSPVPAPAVEPSCFNERFVQPDVEVTRIIDILFVMDTSGSMSDNRVKVADGISAFIAELPPQTDYRIGVMLAHGGRSNWSGKLFTYQNNTVFNSQTTSLSSIRTELSRMVLHAPLDTSGEQGESGSFSLMKGLTANLAANRQAGLFRPEAALAVVFVSDENDYCAQYTAPVTTMSASSGMTSAERSLRRRDCVNGISTHQVIEQVKTVQGTRPYLFGAVVHKDASYRDSARNDGYGWGYMETVQATNGVSTEINDGSYTEGLAAMGKLATSKLNLLLDFTLARPEIDTSTIMAYIDGIQSEFVFDQAANEVHLASGGDARSVIDINYCLKVEEAAPTPEPTPTPVWTLPPS